MSKLSGQPGPAENLEEEPPQREGGQQGNKPRGAREDEGMREGAVGG